ncbi:cytochrome c family protein [Sphingomonas sp. LaA6.9]|uniref:c-type cytochrome n=1 Tax=Sphingomonas sp. LaA6.9 TaxID=2919914 RepID=UPI001F4F6FFD|nr:c-type cytochrome [Sphingomonas sp. LaA6.9]MCJ8155978.1 c-type cytochrome [Sphingomonas sp. LaA6.9]
MRSIGLSILALAALTLAGCGGDKAAGPGDEVARCATCHSFDKDGAKRSGPNLHDILGKTAGTQAGFTYSNAMKGSGVTWTAETLDAFIAAPNKIVPGNRMGFAGEADAARRKAIIAYIEAESAK